MPTSWLVRMADCHSRTVVWSACASRRSRIGRAILGANLNAAIRSTLLIALATTLDGARSQPTRTAR